MYIKKQRITSKWKNIQSRTNQHGNWGSDVFKHSAVVAHRGLTEGNHFAILFLTFPNLPTHRDVPLLILQNEALIIVTSVPPLLAANRWTPDELKLTSEYPKRLLRHYSLFVSGLSKSSDEYTIIFMLYSLKNCPNFRLFFVYISLNLHKPCHVWLDRYNL